MNRCLRCVMPDTRPDTPFVDGVCAPCLIYEKRPEINWEGRKELLLALLERRRNPSGYDCIVPSSAGKDSHYQVLKLIELGARPLVVTASTCHLTKLGRKNIDNLARYATTIEVSPNKTVRAKLNKLGLELVGDISWPEHVSIFTTPFRVAAQYGIPLIFYGENPQNQYGGPAGTEEALTMTRRWRSEFGGFLGLRPSDMVGKLNITKRDMLDYEMPDERLTDAFNVQAHFLGQYLPWDSHENAKIAIEAGMRYGGNRDKDPPTPANWWPWENLDNAQTGLHDWFGFLKYGYGRLCAQLSVDIRTGRITRNVAMQLVDQRDGMFPAVYAEVKVGDVLERIGVTYAQLLKLAVRFSATELSKRMLEEMV